jgi:3-oxoacyl-[acyl-carrier protein] reductase
MCHCLNKIALVTGATRGIGRAISTQLGKQGAIVVGTATTPAGAEEISAFLSQENIKGRGQVLNVTDSAAIDDVFGSIQEEFGAPDILINNAGITRDQLLLRMKDEQWDEIMATNLTSVFKVSRLAIRGMLKKRYGRIISISSVVSQLGNAGQTNYAAAKAGIEGFTRSLAREVAKHGVTVNAVAPGFIDTDMTRVLPDAHKENLLGMIPMNRLGTAAEVAYTVGFLASDEASYITGITLAVNGGMLMG